MAATVNDALRDLQLRHSVGIQRLSTDILRKIIRLLNQSDAEIVAKLLARGATLEGSFTSVRLKYLLDALRTINRDAHVQVGATLRQELRDLAKYEADFQKGLLTNVIPVAVDFVSPTAPMLNAIVTARPMQGALLREHVKGLEASKQRALANAVRLGMVEGEPMAEIVRRVRGTRAANYRDGILAAPRASAERLVRTAVNFTANAAREIVYEQNSDLIKGVQWVATLDGRTCPSCGALDGQVFEMNLEEAVKTEGPRPPLHLNCFPGDTLVLPGPSVSAVSKRWFDGELIVASTAAGRELTCTPNHPILTPVGWQAAKHLKLGDKVVCDTIGQGPAFADRHHEDAPAPIEHVVEAFLASRSVVAVPMPVTAPDFHGDGIDGQVAIVGADRFLGKGVQVSRAEHRFETAVYVGFAAAGCLVCGGSFLQGFDADLTSTDRVMGLGSQAAALFLAGIGHPEEHRIRSAPQWQSGFTDEPLDGTTRDAESLCERLHADTGGVASDEVVSIDRRQFSGHVYNLETADHLIRTGSGIVTHNCRCATVPVTKSWRELGIDADEVPPGTRASMNGQVSATETYDTWLRKQSADVQDEALGKTRGQAYRSGGLSVDRFVDVRGNQWSLDELRKREAAAFEKAGLG